MMKAAHERYAKYIKLFLYLMVVVLINLVGLTLFFRADLTQNRIYSLSDVSKKIVATLSEPLTVKVFFTKDLPPPHNNTQRYLQDLLNEYAIHNRKYFKPQFYNVNPESETISDDARDNREMARSYGIQPVQIQMVDNDEVKFKQAFMGLVLIHGDIIERIPTITSTNGLEYQLTTTIQKLNHKVSALLNLEEKIKIDLVLSSSFYQVAPAMGIQSLPSYPEAIEKMVEALNAKSYNQLVFRHIDPTADTEAAKEVVGFNIMQRQWPDIPEANVKAGKGSIGLLMRYKETARIIPLLQEFNLPIFGRQYKLAEAEVVKEAIETNLERLININEEMGYLADYGTLSPFNMNPMAPQNAETISGFRAVMEKTYTLHPLRLTEDPIPNGLQCFIIPRPTEKLSDFALYQIDQALMNGTNLAIFMDAFKEARPTGQQPFMANQMPRYVPMDTRLEAMLAHYGIRIKQSIVLDENCHRQRLPQNQGGGVQQIYFAPIIQKQHINQDLAYLKNIKSLTTYKISPLELDQARIDAQELSVHQLLASSKRSWELRDQITLNPLFLRPPATDKEMASLPLAYLVEGSFESYFKGKPMPEKPKEENPEAGTTEADQPAPKTDSQMDLSKITGKSAFKERSQGAKIFVVASSEMIKNQLMELSDQAGQQTNAVFMLNIMDALNNREDIAAMRSKAQQYNPMKPTGATAKVLIKAANMVGLPMVVILCGLMVWYRRRARQRLIKRRFQGDTNQS